MDQAQFNYLFWGYAVAWLGVTLFVVALVARERRLRREMDSLRRLVMEHRGEPALAEESRGEPGASVS